MDANIDAVRRQSQNLDELFAAKMRECLRGLKELAREESENSDAKLLATLQNEERESGKAEEEGVGECAGAAADEKAASSCEDELPPRAPAGPDDLQNDDYDTKWVSPDSARPQSPRPP